MSVDVKQKWTAAEQVLMSGLCTEDVHKTIAAARHAALAEFSRHGLPSRRLENWHYTDLRVLLRNVPIIRNAEPEPGFLPPLVTGSSVLRLSDGQAIAYPPLPFATALAPDLEKGNTKALPQWRVGDIISQINTAHVTDGWKIDVPADYDPGQLIEIQHECHHGGSHVFMPITIADNTDVTLILRETGNDAAALTSALACLQVGAGAQVTFIILCQGGAQTSRLNQFNAQLAQGAKLTLFLVNAGVQLLRQEVNVTLAGKRSDFQLRGINLLDGNTHTDITMDVHHECEATSSTEILRNVVTDKARGVFQGMIRVAQAAQKTDSRMTCNSLILSDRAEFDAKPELEIFADDVACGHGATVVEINREHLFYLMARGIPQPQARAMLIAAFVAELTQDLEHEQLSQAIKETIEQWLENRVAHRIQQGINQALNQDMMQEEAVR